MVAGRAIRRRIIVAVAIHTLTHLERLDLGDLFHRGDVAVASRTDSCCAHRFATRAVGDLVRVLRQISYVRFMHESHVVRHSMHPFPVDRMWAVANYPCCGADLS